MHLAGRDADFRAHAEFAAVGKLRAGVAHQDGAVEPVEKALRGGVVFGQDRLGVLAAVAADVVDGLIHPVDQFRCDDHVEELAAEVVRLCLDGPGDLQKFALGPDFDTGFQQVLDQHGPVLGVELPVDQQAFGGPADAGAAGLGVQDHAAGLVEVGVAVGVDVADSFEMGKNRDARLALDEADKAAASPGDDDVDVLRGLQHRRHHLAVAGGHELDRGGGKVGGFQPVEHAGMDRLGGLIAFAAATKDDGIAGLEAEGTRVGSDVGAGFVDHAHDTQGGGDALDVKAIGAVPFGKDAAHRVLLFGDLAQRVDNPAQAAVVKAQAVAHRQGDPTLVGGVEIEGVGVENLLPTPPDGISRSDQGGGFPFRGGTGEFRRCRAGLLADLGHQVGELAVHCASLFRPGGGVFENSAPEISKFPVRFL